MFYNDLPEYPFCDDILPILVFTEGLDRWQLHLHCEGSGEGSCHLRRYSKVCCLHHVGAHCGGGRCGISPGRVSIVRNSRMMKQCGQRWSKSSSAWLSACPWWELLCSPLAKISLNIFEIYLDFDGSWWNSQELRCTSEAGLYITSVCQFCRCLEPQLSSIIVDMNPPNTPLPYQQQEAFFGAPFFFSFFSNKLACFWFPRILFLILVTDLPPSIALGMEPGERTQLLRHDLFFGWWTKCSQICWMQVGSLFWLYGNRIFMDFPVTSLWRGTSWISLQDRKRNPSLLGQVCWMVNPIHAKMK